MNLIVDTNAYSDYVRGNKSILAKLNNADIVYVPVIVLGELKRGFYYGRKIPQNITALKRFLAKARVKVLDIDTKTAEHYGEVAAFLKRNGTPIPASDIWIAALCVQYDLPLLTRDSDFQHLPQVAVL